MKAIRRAFKSSSFHQQGKDASKEKEREREKQNQENTSSTNTLATTTTTTEGRDEKHVQFKHTSTINSASDIHRSASPTAPSLVASASASRLPMSPSTSSSASGTWSGMVQFDLVENLSQRERTRQEVLWEIVASESRYVDDLSSLYELYIKPLLYPYTRNIEIVQIPEKMRNVMHTLGSNILPNHISLSKDLKARHDAQYPLIRSLADIFLIHSHNLQYYSTYVLHLEYSLSIVDEAISLASGGSINKRSDKYESWKLGKRLLELESEAQSNSEAGLAISLLKPFQRLLKYPLLFRNLLFNSDPSMIEYESTLKMVEQVESIVRSIEDKKIQIEERDKTRDALARIDGIEKERSLMAPKPGRLLIKEVCISPTNPPANIKLKHGSMPPPQQPHVIKKTSVRRLSDLLPHSHSPISQANNTDNKTRYTKKDLWHVEFNDVTLLCQRCGRTTLPIASNDKQSVKRSSLSSNRSDSMGLNGRNLYRFIKVSKWNITNQSEEGIVSMNAILRSRSNSAEVHGLSPPNKPFPFPSTASPRTSAHQLKNSDDAKSRASTKMSFSYARGDEMVPRVRLRPKPVPVAEGGGEQRAGVRDSREGEQEQEQRRAAAKFGTRLRPSNASQTNINVTQDRPSSRATTTGAKATQKEVIVKRTLTPQPPPTSSRAKLDAVNSSSHKVQRRRAQVYNEKLPKGSGQENGSGNDDENASLSSTSSMDTHSNTRARRPRKSRAGSEDSGMLLVEVAQQYLAQSEPPAR